MTPSLTRESIVARLCAALEPLPHVIALWEGGSAAWKRADEWSDVDVQVLIDAESSAPTIAAVDAALATASPIELRFPAPAPTWHGHDQVFYRLRDAGEFRLVDVAVMRRGQGQPLSERERHGERLVAFDKTGEAAATALDARTHGRRVAARLEQLRVSFPLFQSLAKKEILRGNEIAAASFYFTHTLQPLVALLRIQHCPERFDFGPKYAQVDLPAAWVEALEPLFYVASPAELAEKQARAEALFAAALAQPGAAPPADDRWARHFAAYAAAFDAFDGDAVAGFFRAPCLLVSSGGAHALPSEAAIGANMRALVDYHRQKRVLRVRGTIERALALADDLALVSVHWRAEREPPHQPWDFTNTYQLLRVEGAWKIVASTTHGAVPS